MRRFVANSWFGALQQPRFAIPLPAFVVVGGVYLLVGVVRYRALERQNATAARLGLIVLVLNEIWNLAFFGARSTVMRSLAASSSRSAHAGAARAL